MIVEFRSIVFQQEEGDTNVKGKFESNVTDK